MHDARAIDKLARELWRARPDVVLAEMDRKLEAAELGGDALDALVAVGEQIGRCEAENERLRADIEGLRLLLRPFHAHVQWDDAPRPLRRHR